MLAANYTINTNKFFISGWTVIGGYLTFLRSTLIAASLDWTSAPESAVTSGSSGDTGGQSLDYIVVRGSERWNGLHRVQTAGTEGQLITYTKVNEVLPYWEDQTFDFTEEERIHEDTGGTDVYLGSHFSAGDYLYTSGSANLVNTGLFSVDSVNVSGLASAVSSVTVGTKYFVMDATLASVEVASSFALNEEGSTAAGFTAEDDQTDINIYKAYREHCYILTDVNVLNDENDELDIPRYLANGLVYYVKAKYAEDTGNIEMKEYFMKEFRRITEKHQSAKKMGTYIAQGFHLLRT
jgi:hypothetical protein